MQFEQDQQLPRHQQKWVHFSVDDAGTEPMIMLATHSMLRAAAVDGHGEPGFIDATHGLQRYGLKLVTYLVKDVEMKGMPSLCGLNGSCDLDIAQPRSCSTSIAMHEH